MEIDRPITLTVALVTAGAVRLCLLRVDDRLLRGNVGGLHRYQAQVDRLLAIAGGEREAEMERVQHRLG